MRARLPQQSRSPSLIPHPRPERGSVTLSQLFYGSLQRSATALQHEGISLRVPRRSTDQTSEDARHSAVCGSLSRLSAEMRAATSQLHACRVVRASMHTQITCVSV